MQLAETEVHTVEIKHILRKLESTTWEGKFSVKLLNCYNSCFNLDVHVLLTPDN